MMDHYSREQLVRDRINGFQHEAAHQQLVRAARGETQPTRPPTWTGLLVVTGMIARLIGVAFKSA